VTDVASTSTLAVFAGNVEVLIVKLHQLFRIAE
jgi:hypothetical protein